jgi:hypothetical protein
MDRRISIRGVRDRFVSVKDSEFTGPVQHTAWPALGEGPRIDTSASSGKRYEFRSTLSPRAPEVWFIVGRCGNMGSGSGAERTLPLGCVNLLLDSKL